MSRNGSGTYALPAPYPSGFANGTTIDAPTMNTVFTDVQSAITGSTAADGQTPITGNWNWSGKNISGVATLTAVGGLFTDVTISNGATVAGTLAAKGGAFNDISTTAGATVGDGLVVSKGGATITGNSTITGTLAGLTGLTIASGGATVTGTVTLTGTLDASGNVTAADATKGAQVVTYQQFPFTAAGTGSVALPSGLIIKWGTGTYTAGAGSVTFGSNFPTAMLSAQVSLLTSGAAHGAFPPGATLASYSVSGFDVYGGTAQNGTFSWLALGH